MKKDGKGLVNYQLENRGHTEEWVELCKQFETFWKKVKIPVTLNLDDPSIYIKESTMNKKGMIWNFNEGRDQSIYFDKLADLVFDILEPRSDSGDYENLYKRALRAYQSHKRINLNNYEKDLLSQTVNINSSDSELETINFFTRGHCFYTREVDGIHYRDNSGYDTLVEEFLDDSLSFKENRRLKEGESYFGKNYNWYTPKPLARVPDEFTDAYEWVFAKIGNRTFWKTNGDAVGNPFKSNSDSVAQQVGFLDFEKASYDFDVMTKFTFNFDKGKEVYPIFEEPEKALKYYQKYNVREVLEELGYSTTSIDALEIYLEEVNDN